MPGPDNPLTTSPTLGSSGIPFNSSAASPQFETAEYAPQWRTFEIGDTQPSAVSIIAGFSQPLAQAGISIHWISKESRGLQSKRWRLIVRFQMTPLSSFKE